MLQGDEVRPVLGDAVADACKARILEAIGTAGALELPDGSLYTRKQVNKAAYTVEAQSYIELRRKSK